MSDTFTCQGCGETFRKGWTDADALAELAERWPGVAPEDCGLLCDACAQKFEAWFAARGAEPENTAGQD